MGALRWDQFSPCEPVYVHCTIIVKNYFALQHREKINLQVRFRDLPGSNSGIIISGAGVSGKICGGRIMISTNSVVNQYPFLGPNE
jgi:hypothetical protein